MNTATTSIRFSVALGMLVALCLWYSGCSSPGRLEPLMREPAQARKKIISTWTDHESVLGFSSTLRKFCKGVEKNSCPISWQLLSSATRLKLAQALGSEQSAKEKFCSKKVLLTAICGVGVEFIQTAPPELNIEPPDKGKVFYVIHRDGTFCPVIGIQENGKWRIEPLQP